MGRPPFIILRKSEWDRLQRQGGPAQEEPVNIKIKYLKALTEQSRELMKTWPDSAAGVLANIEKQKKNKEQSNIEFIKAYKKSAGKTKKQNTTKAITEARQLIFEGSNYGRKLLSALLESRAIDERDAQLKLNKEIQAQAAELAKGEVSKRGIRFLDNNEEREKQEKSRTLECNRTNKEIILLKKEKELRERLIEKQCAIEEERLMKQVEEIEKEEKEDIKRCERMKIEEYEADTKKLATLKEHDEKLTDTLIEAYKDEQDRIKLKTRAVLKKVYQGRPETKWSNDLFEKIRQIQTEENKRYEDFIDKGVKEYEKRSSKKETMVKQQEKQKSSSRYLISQMNKIVGQELALDKKCANKCACDRQSLLMNLTPKPAMKTETKSSDATSTTNMQKNSAMICDRKAEKLSFLAPRNKLIEELRTREKEPFPWNATQGAHAHFAKEADKVLKEIKHKYFVRKVVDEYRKLNCLNITALPVPNY